jgi:transposase
MLCHNVGMARPFATTIVPEADRHELERLLRASNTTQSKALRARIILLSGDGKTAEEVAEATGTTTITVYKWRRRYKAAGIAGLDDAARPGQPRKLSLAKQKEILKLTTERIPREATHWSERLMAKHAGVTVHQVRQVWKAANLQPHRLKTFKISNDPHFAEKVIDVVGLYMSPPDNAVVLSVDEKTQIQALDRTQPMLPLKPGQVERRTHDYKRNGTASLYAAFDIATGKVIGRVTKRHRAKEFIAFLAQIDREQPRDLDLHLILDNSSTHKTPEVNAWLQAHPRFKLHFTPTSASWLNAVESWFGSLERRAIYRGVFPSVKALRDEIHRFIRVHNAEIAKPFKWTKEAGVIIDAVERAKKAAGY